MELTYHPVGNSSQHGLLSSAMPVQVDGLDLTGSLISGAKYEYYVSLEVANLAMLTVKNAGGKVLKGVSINGNSMAAAIVAYNAKH